MHTPTIKYIVDTVAEYYHISSDSLLYGNRERKYSEPRHIVAYLLHCLGMSYPAIAKLFHKKSHRTIIYAVNKVKDWRTTPVLNRDANRCIDYVLDYPSKIKVNYIKCTIE